MLALLFVNVKVKIVKHCDILWRQIKGLVKSEHRLTKTEEGKLRVIKYRQELQSSEKLS